MLFEQTSTAVEKCRNAVNLALTGIGAIPPLFQAPYGRMRAHALGMPRNESSRLLAGQINPKDYETDLIHSSQPIKAGDIVKRVSETVEFLMCVGKVDPKSPEREPRRL